MKYPFVVKFNYDNGAVKENRECVVYSEEDKVIQLVRNKFETDSDTVISIIYIQRMEDDSVVLLDSKEAKQICIPLKKGDRIWYVDKENKELESGTVYLTIYKDGKLVSFSVNFDCNDFDEFSGSAFGKYFFNNKERAEKALLE